MEIVKTEDYLNISISRMKWKDILIGYLGRLQYKLKNSKP